MDDSNSPTPGLSINPTIVRVRASNDGEFGHEDASQPRFSIIAPPGDYSGFIGGPVARMNDDGDADVIGMIVGAEPSPPTEPDRRLSVTLLDPTFIGAAR